MNRELGEPPEIPDVKRLAKSEALADGLPGSPGVWSAGSWAVGSFGAKSSRANTMKLIASSVGIENRSAGPRISTWTCLTLAADGLLQTMPFLNVPNRGIPGVVPNAAQGQRPGGNLSTVHQRD